MSRQIAEDEESQWKLKQLYSVQRLLARDIRNNYHHQQQTYEFTAGWDDVKN